MLNEQTQIVVELPTDWMLNPVDGARHRIFLTNVMGALSKLHPSIVVRDVPWGTDLVERSPSARRRTFFLSLCRKSAWSLALKRSRHTALIRYRSNWSLWLV